MSTIFSGIQPTGNLHLGNYLGAIKNWINLQKKHRAIFCIVDLHAITLPQNPQELKKNIYQTAALYLASGISPQKSIIFIQSQVSAHTELAWIFNCLLKMGELRRMTQFKEKSQKDREEAGVGLFVYPALMAADILLYDTDFVPVGEDQKQHIELTRKIAQRFNYRFGETFKLPQPLIKREGARIMALDNPEQKMSKSASSDFSRINLLDPPSLIRKKIARATTDSLREIKFDSTRPGLYNLLTIYKLITQTSKQEIETNLKDKGYAQLKQTLSQSIIAELSPLQRKFQKIIRNKNCLKKILEQGRQQAQKIAETKLKEVKKKIGLK